MESNYQSLGQVSSQDAGQIFRDHLRGFARQMISEVMAAEVNELCGPKHKPSDREFVSQYSQQTPVRDAFLSRDRSSHTMDIVRVAGGRKRIPQDLRQQLSLSFFSCRERTRANPMKMQLNSSSSISPNRSTPPGTK